MRRVSVFSPGAQFKPRRDDGSGDEDTVISSGNLDASACDTEHACSRLFLTLTEYSCALAHLNQRA